MTALHDVHLRADAGDEASADPSRPPAPDRWLGVRTPVVALLILAIVAVAGVGGLAAWALDRDEPRFCHAASPLTPRNFELPGYEVTMEDGGEPGPDPCDNPDRPGSAESDDTGGYHVPPASSTSLPPGSAPAVEVADPRVVLGFDCRYRDADGDVVATADPNRPDDTCTLPDR
jgi:hypothetical protein